MTQSSPFAKGVCPRCGKTGHIPKECRFIDTTCRFCQKKGHIEAVCLKKKGTQSQKKQSIGVITREPTRTVHNIPGHDPRVQHLQLNGKQFRFEVDSGARDNFCSRHVWTELGRPKLQPARMHYVSAAGETCLSLVVLKPRLRRQLATEPSDHIECLITPTFEFATTDCNSSVRY